MSVADDLKLIMDKIPEALVPEKAAGLTAIIQLNLDGDGGGRWYFRLDNGQITVHTGEADRPNLTLSMLARDYVALSLGQASPMGLFMGGKIKVQGDLSLAMKFPELFDRDRVSD
ncbi:MAG: sterol carrier protein [Chloroflexi bacterium]|nr:MAG: sterol carrier protein [Chloroflexota bacterium]